MISPCKGCEDRIPGCHSSCTRYEDWKIENAAQKDWLREKNQTVISDSVVRKFWKNMRRSRKPVVINSRENS